MSAPSLLPAHGVWQLLLLPHAPLPINWTGGNDKWENYTHWSVGHPPSLNDAADVITHAGNNAVTIDETTVDPDGFSATGGTCPCLPNTVQLTINGVFSPGAVLIDETACVGCINNAFTLTA